MRYIWPLCQRKCRSGFCAAECSCPATLEAVCGYTPVSFLLAWRENRLLYMHRQSCKAPNPYSEIPSLIRVQLLMLYAASLILNTPLLLSPGSCSWSPQGSYKSNFRTYSNFWCWGDENSPSAHSQRISWSKVRSFIGLTSVVSYMITCHQKTYSNISPAIPFALCWARHNAYLWMHLVLPICRYSLTWFMTLPDINQWSWDVLL